MKVNTPPSSKPDFAQPAGAMPQGQPERELEQEADLFKQAMGDTAPPSDSMRAGARLSGASTSGQKPAGRTGQPKDETTPPPGTGGGTDPAPAGTGANPEDKASLARDAGLFKQAMGDTTSRPTPGKTGRHAGDTESRSGLKQGLAGQTGAGNTSPPAGPVPGTTSQPPAPDPVPGEKDADGLLRKDEAETQPATDVQQDLQQLLADQMMRSQTASMQRAEAGASETISPQLVSDVAQRILVSAGQEGQGKEVRIQIKDTLLQDTEVIIAHRQGGLQVTFVTQSPSDNAMLTRSRDAITSSLEQALDGSVKVNVDADTDSRDQRSRGEYIEQEDV